MKKRWKVVIVEPCHLVCAGIVQTFARTAFSRHAHYLTMKDLWNATREDDQIDLFIIDVEQSLASFRSDIAKLQQRFPDSFIVLLSETIDHNAAMQALQTGVHGFISKATRTDAMIKSLELIVLGERIFPAHVLTIGDTSAEAYAATRLNDDSQMKLFGLSARELEVLRSLGEGKSNKEIARQLDISDETVKVHVKAILRKLRLKNRTKAALWINGSRVPELLPDTDLKLPGSSAAPRLGPVNH